MNSVIWLMYAADVVAGMNTFAFMYILVASICSMGCVAVHVETGEEAPKTWGKRGAVSVLVAAVVAMLLPSRQTMYAAAVLNATEAIAATPIGTKAATALNAVLDKIIAETATKEKK